MRKLLFDTHQRITRQPCFVNRPPSQALEFPEMFLCFLPEAGQFFCHLSPPLSNLVDSVHRKSTQASGYQNKTTFALPFGFPFQNVFTLQIQKPTIYITNFITDKLNLTVDMLHITNIQSRLIPEANTNERNLLL